MKLFTPGPVDVTSEVLGAQASPILHHREQEFSEIMMEVEDLAKKVFRSEDPVVVLTSSGTGAMEACFASTLKPGDKALVISNGKFGERLAQIATIYSELIHIKLKWGQKFEIEKVREVIETQNPDVVAMVHNETSTGMRNLVSKVAEIAKGEGALVIVDAVSSLGGDDVRKDNVDLLLAGSQKCLGAPPGLSLISVSEEAINRMNEEPRSYYFHIPYYLKKMKDGQTPYTPAITLVYSLRKALRRVLDEGMERRIRRHRKGAEIVRKRIRRMGLEIFPPKGHESNTLTAVKYEEAENVRKKLKERGYLIAGGQGELKGKIFRIAHMGDFKLEDLKELLDNLEECI